jgi:hypothetical protein
LASRIIAQLFCTLEHRDVNRLERIIFNKPQASPALSTASSMKW